MVIFSLFCPYCGNKSGKQDSYGNCVSCGGQLEQCGMENGNVESKPIPIPSYAAYYGFNLGIFSANEIRKMMNITEDGTVFDFSSGSHFGGA